MPAPQVAAEPHSNSITAVRGSWRRSLSRGVTRRRIGEFQFPDVPPVKVIVRAAWSKTGDPLDLADRDGFLALRVEQQVHDDGHALARVGRELDEQLVRERGRRVALDHDGAAVLGGRRRA